jgi:hypothetical protein
MTEIWEEIFDFPGYYISNYGNIKKIYKNNKTKILKLYTNKQKFLFVYLKKNGKNNYFLIHCLVAQYFLTNDNNKKLVYHLDNDRSNNYYLNLKYYNVDDNLFNILENETFKLIKKYPNYYISNFGRIKSINYNEEKILNINIDSRGYKYIDLLHLGKPKKKFRIHRLIAKYFIPNPEKKKLIDHIDRNRLNNNIDNLRWVTHAENNFNHSMHSNNTSGYNGVSWDKNSNKWISQIGFNNKHIRLGGFDDINLAIEAHENAKRKLHKIN